MDLLHRKLSIIARCLINRAFERNSSLLHLIITAQFCSSVCRSAIIRTARWCSYLGNCNRWEKRPLQRQGYRWHMAFVQGRSSPDTRRGTSHGCRERLGWLASGSAKPELTTEGNTCCWWLLTNIQSYDILFPQKKTNCNGKSSAASYWRLRLLTN